MQNCSVSIKYFKRWRKCISYVIQRNVLSSGLGVYALNILKSLFVTDCRNINMEGRLLVILNSILYKLLNLKKVIK